MLYVCDQEFNRLGIISGFSYLLWSRKFSEAGECELHVPVTKKNLELLQQENVLFRNDCSEGMFICYRNIETKETGEEYLKIKACSLIKWLERRTIWFTMNFNDTPRTIARKMIEDQAITPYDPVRKINQIVLGNSADFGEKIIYQRSFGILYEELETLCNTYDMGMSAKIDIPNKKVLIDFYEGTNRTVNQTDRMSCILSKKFANIISSTLEESCEDFKNTCLIGGFGEGAERYFQSIENGEGLNRYEMFVDAKDIEDQDIPQVDYEWALHNRGLSKLEEHMKTQSFECEIDSTKQNTKYNRDYFLGDIITIRDDKLGVIMDSRVVQVDEVFQNKEKSTFITIGKGFLTFDKKIKNMIG